MLNDLVPPELAGYLEKIVGLLRERLGGQLLAVYLYGSAGAGAYVHGTSDVDVAVVASAPLDLETKQDVVASLDHERLPCPARRLELVVYTRAQAEDGTAFDMNLNTGADTDTHVSFEASSQPQHWFVVDRAIIRRSARALLGPPARNLFGEPPPRVLLQALLESMRWHDANDSASVAAVLNACRALMYAEEGVWATKTEAASWAMGGTGFDAVIAAALARRSGDDGAVVDREAAIRFSRWVQDRVTSRLLQG